MVTVWEIASALGLVLMSGLFSGLTLGLLGLDLVSLEVIIGSGSPREAEYAKKIYPVRKRGNLLLCTLLLGNTAVNAALSIVMTSISGSGLSAFFISTGLIVVFGEIIPQATCARYGLAIGAHTVFLVKLVMVLVFVIAWPISVILDKVLGAELGTIYNRREFKKLIEIHFRNTQESGINEEETTLMTGALEFSEKTVAQVMTPMNHVYSLEVDVPLDFEQITNILDSGHSRIPVYEKDRSNIVGLLIVKDLALVDPDDCTPIRTILSFYGRKLLKVFPDLHLNVMLSQFKTQHTHMAIVTDVNNDADDRDPYYESIGIVTLEDVIEELIGDEIVDETDVYVHMEQHDLVGRKKVNYKNLWGARRIDQAPSIPPELQNAVVAFLSRNCAPFEPKLISESVLKRLVARASVVEIKVDDHAKREAWLYRRNTPDSTFTLVLQGKVQVMAGNEGFVSEQGPFTTLAVGALTADTYEPDFSAKVMPGLTTQLLHVTRAQYQAALQAQKLSELASTKRSSAGGHTAEASPMSARKATPTAETSVSPATIVASSLPPTPNSNAAAATPQAGDTTGPGDLSRSSSISMQDRPRRADGDERTPTRRNSAQTAPMRRSSSKGGKPGDAANGGGTATQASRTAVGD